MLFSWSLLDASSSVSGTNESLGAQSYKTPLKLCRENIDLEMEGHCREVQHLIEPNQVLRRRQQPPKLGTE